MIIEPGLYYHFKGTYYKVIGEVLDSDTGEVKVLYKNIYNNYYCRSVESWILPAEDEYGNQIERYRRVGN